MNDSFMLESDGDFLVKFLDSSFNKFSVFTNNTVNY